MGTSGYLREQGTRLQGSDSGSAVTWCSVEFTWVDDLQCVMTTGDRSAFKIDFASLFTTFLCFLEFAWICKLPAGPIMTKSPALAGLACIISKPEARSQGGLQPDVTRPKGFSEMVVSSAWGQSGMNPSLPVTFKAKTAVIAAGGTRQGLGRHLFDQTRRRYWRRQGCLSTSILQEQQKSSQILLSVYGTR